MLVQFVTVVWRIQGHSVFVQYVSMEDTRIQCVSQYVSMEDTRIQCVSTVCYCSMEDTRTQSVSTVC